MKFRLSPIALAAEAFFALPLSARAVVRAAVAGPPTDRCLSPSLTIHAGFLSQQEMDALTIELDGDSVDTYYSPALIPHDAADRLGDLGRRTVAAALVDHWTCGAGAGEGEAGARAAVMTMLMTATMDRHRDCHVPQAKGRVMEDDIAFVVLGSDPRAFFVHSGGEEDGEEGGTQPEEAAHPAVRVTVAARTLVRFRGDVPRNTVVPPDRPSGSSDHSTPAWSTSVAAPPSASLCGTAAGAPRHLRRQRHRRRIFMAGYGGGRGAPVLRGARRRGYASSAAAAQRCSAAMPLFNQVAVQRGSGEKINA